MKVRSVTELQELLDSEFAWRIKELSLIKGTIHQADGPAQKAFLRAGIPILYAHWEGFVKIASTAYIDFVNRQKLRHEELSPCFVAMAARRHLENFGQAKKARIHIEVVKFFLDNLTERASLGDFSGLQTKSNLNAEVFENIACAIGVNPVNYEAKFKFLDESLLRRRNEAHGAYLDIDKDSFDDLLQEVLTLLRQYKTDIENCATL
ncbi:MAG TPA: MAE_28990/MAE_18760 family HEPN-like nuclease [Chthoniobacterales bacterium]|jgi:hypothetical protein|nr:MAE_28990/MAE_18760 family HEPN-like nuclease [Chthoniobacterales bacterium]